MLDTSWSNKYICEMSTFPKQKHIKYLVFLKLDIALESPALEECNKEIYIVRPPYCQTDRQIDSQTSKMIIFTWIVISYIPSLIICYQFHVIVYAV